jgi:hypothetical protein
MKAANMVGAGSACAGPTATRYGPCRLGGKERPCCHPRALQDGATRLMTAVRSGDLEMVGWLLCQGDDKDQANEVSSKRLEVHERLDMICVLPSLSLCLADVAYS